MLNLQNDQEIKVVPRLIHELAEAEEDVKSGRTAPIKETVDNVRSRLLKMKSESRK